MRTRPRQAIRRLLYDNNAPDCATPRSADGVVVLQLVFVRVRHAAAWCSVRCRSARRERRPRPPSAPAVTGAARTSPVRRSATTASEPAHTSIVPLDAGARMDFGSTTSHAARPRAPPASGWRPESREDARQVGLDGPLAMPEPARIRLLGGRRRPSAAPSRAHGPVRPSGPSRMRRIWRSARPRSDRAESRPRAVDPVEQGALQPPVGCNPRGSRPPRRERLKDPAGRRTT